MDNLQDTSIFEFNIDEEGKSNISTIAQWANISAIVGFIGMGVSVISFVISMSRVTGYENRTAVAGSGGLGILISLAISLALNLTLINAGMNLKKGIDLSNQSFFAVGLTKLATYFKIVGILTIIVIVIFALVLLVLMMVGTARLN